MNTIYGIIKNEKYSGRYMLGDELVDKIYPPIISQEIFSTVRAKVNANKYGKRSVDVVYLLRHKMKCGYCGESIIAECGTSKMGDRRYYYKCHGRKNLRNGCQQKAFRKETLEKFILDAILGELKKPHNIEHITKGVLALQESQIKTSSTLGILEKERKQNESAIENIMSAVERGFFNATANKRMRELEERQSELDRLIIIERSKMQVKVSAEEIRTFYEAALLQESQILINYPSPEGLACLPLAREPTTLPTCVKSLSRHKPPLKCD